MKKLTLGLSLISISILAGCVSQDQADTKMIKGCEGAVNTMIAPKSLTAIKSKNISEESNQDGSNYRRVAIVATEKDGWMELDKQYSCLFAQQWGFMKASHTALLEQVTYDDKILGKKDGQIVGSMQDFIKLTEGADTAMGQ